MIHWFCRWQFICSIFFSLVISSLILSFLNIHLGFFHFHVVNCLGLFPNNCHGLFPDNSIFFFFNSIFFFNGLVFLISRLLWARLTSSFPGRLTLRWLGCFWLLTYSSRTPWSFTYHDEAFWTCHTLICVKKKMHNGKHITQYKEKRRTCAPIKFWTKWPSRMRFEIPIQLGLTLNLFSCRWHKYYRTPPRRPSFFNLKHSKDKCRISKASYWWQQRTWSW